MASLSSVFHIREHVIPGEYTREYARATGTSQDDQLVLHVKQYTPKANGPPQFGDLSIIGCHANGFPKELYEPLWEDLVNELKAKGIRVASIWIADCAWQGQSGILNKLKLGNDPSVFDYARDVLQMINHFRMPHPLIGVGHSVGATALTKLALFHPRLFSTLIQIDPIISEYNAKTALTLPAMSGKRRDKWPSREAAAEMFKKNKFYQRWDPRVLDRWVSFGLTDASPGSGGGEVTLTTSKHQEVFTFARPSHHAVSRDGKSVNRDLVPDMDLRNGPIAPIYRPEASHVFEQLQHLSPWALWLYGGQSYMSPAQRTANIEITGTGIGGNGGVATGRVGFVVGEDWGHLIPLEAPTFVARAAADFLPRAIKHWEAQERDYKAWAAKPLSEKTRISQTTQDEIVKALKSKM